MESVTRNSNYFGAHNCTIVMTIIVKLFLLGLVEAVRNGVIFLMPLLFAL